MKVFGTALYEYWKGDHRTPYSVRRDDGYLDKASLQPYFTRKLFPTEKAILSSVHGKILDVGCGAGRHVLYFQKKKFDITGIDVAPLAIQTCKERGCRKVYVTDIFSSKLKPKSFDTILLFGHNIGIAGTIAGAKKLLRTLRKYIKPNGTLLLTSLDVTKTKEKTHLVYQQKNRKAGRAPGQIKMRIEYKNLTGKWINWLHIEPDALRKIAHESKWNVEKIYMERNGEYGAVLRKFGDVLKKIRLQAKASGLKQSDITKAVQKVRNTPKKISPTE